MADENQAQHRGAAKIVFHLALALFFFGAVDVCRALNPALPPSGNFDLSNWYLQLPTSGGVLTGTSGSVDSASTAQLLAGFTNAYFYTGPDGAMTFWVPDNGAMTSGSSHPRSELRELLDPNNSGLNWTLYGTHILTAQLKVLQVPADTGKVCIGQIHEPNTKPDGSASANNEQMIMFDLANQTIYANINLDGNLSSTFSQTFISGSTVKTNNTINYTMSVVNGLLTISVNSITNSWNLFSGTNYQGHVATNWNLASSNTVYFKAGDYNQTTNQCNCSTDGAQVAFYALTAFHYATITNQPTNFVSGVGGSATFSVGAIGNGSLGYQWLLNGVTNGLVKATNSTLTLTNLSLTNLGNYSVVVTDSTSGFSSVTSSVVTLTGSNFPPVITSQPTSQSVMAGTNVTFTVGEVGTLPMTNHWWFNTNTSVMTTTASSITLTNIQSTNAGSYFVVVNNNYGAVTSAVATLSISAPPTITNQPASLRVNAGTNVSFAVGVSGAPPLYYSWWFNSTNQLAGATNASLSITNVSGANSGNYTVVITNNFGSVTSVVASLAVVVTVTFTNAGSTNWLCPADVSVIQIECWGGGGAGGSAQRTNTGNAYAGGGGGGAYAKINSFAVFPGTNYFINVGLGGSSSTNDLGTVPGGDSWFNTNNSPSSVILAKGGGGGQTVINYTNTGRVGINGVSTNLVSLGDLVFTGGNGGSGLSAPVRVSGGGGGAAGDSGAGGNASAVTNTAALGGSGVFTAGGAGGNGVVSSGANGTNGFAPGGGGGGALASSANGIKIGGAGGVGRVVLTYTASACPSAIAVTPIGSGIGTGGLTICPSQTITLTEIPTAGTAPFTFAWKKVGSPTILGTSSNLVVSVPTHGDQYICDVTSACGNGTSTSPAATLSVAGPGVTLSVSTQSVYRTMSVAVTATVSGSATGGVWTATGTGTFSSTNSLATIYTPSAADAGTTVNLTFTTQGGSCSPAAATDVVTFNQAANPAKVVIIKADDFRGEFNHGQEWTNFLQTTRELGVKVGMGVICTNIVGSNSNLILAWMQSQEALGDVEFWDHAWDHTEWTNGSGQLVEEYQGSGLAYQQQHFAWSQTALFNALGRNVTVFGTPYNGFDTNTATVINAAAPPMNLFFCHQIALARSNLNSGVAVMDIISESNGTGLPNSTNFIATYPGGPTGPISLQFHPPYFINTNGTNSLLEFQKIVQYLLTNGYSVLLPSEYVATLPAITNQPASQFVLTGSNATFAVGATGDPTLAYQWQLSGTNRVGATAATFTVTNAQSTDAGAYTVIVTNFSGVVTSAVASLVIQQPPVINHAQTFASNQTFQLNFTGTPLATYQIQFKTNLTDSLWFTIVSKIMDSNGNCTFVDYSATNSPSRFYRVMAQ
jgi:Alginate lyase/Immunoglobulin domain